MKRELLTRLLLWLANDSDGEDRGSLLMCQHSSFRVTCTTTCELEIGDVMRTDNAVVDLQDVLWYSLPLLEQLVILDEAVVIAANETDSLQVWQYFM